MDISAFFTYFPFFKKNKTKKPNSDQRAEIRCGSDRLKKLKGYESPTQVGQVLDIEA